MEAAKWGKVRIFVPRSCHRSFRVLAKPRIKNKKSINGEKKKCRYGLLLRWTRFHHLPVLGKEAV